jgi:ATP-binding cassette subfamily B multidrug efflux pump
VAESIAGMPVLQASNAAPRFEARFAQLNEAHYRRPPAGAARQRLAAAADAGLPQHAAAGAGDLVFDLRSGGAALGAVEIGVLYAFMSYIARVTEPLTQITMQFSQLQQAMVGAARVQTLLQEAETPPNPPGGEVREGGIRIDHLDFAYQPGRPVLQDIAIELPPGSFHGIVGHTGSGKSTLLSLLLRFYPAPPGRIRIDGTPLEAIGEDHFRDRVGPGAAGPFLLAATARENIAMGRPLTRRAGRGRGAGRACARLHRGAGARLRHAAGRRRRAAVGRPEAAAGDRAGAGRPAAHPVPGRGHRARRFGHRAGGAARAGGSCAAR